MNVQRKQMKDILESLNEYFRRIEIELTNERHCSTEYLTGDLMDINQSYINENIDFMISTLLELKKVKAFNSNNIYK